MSDSESESAYDSDSSDMSDISGTGTESTVSRPVGDQPDYRQFASNLQLLKAGGPNFPTDQEKLQYEELVIAGPYPLQDISGVTIPKTTSSRTTQASIVMIDSRNRDTSVYPQPTFLQLRLPRVYKNVTNFQVIQIKLLSSFFYFRRDKNNLSITIHENGRYLANGEKNAITTSIREGTYSIATLINELTLQLNRTPIFYDYINGFIDFAPLFASTGDYSLSFNQPGDNFYDALNNQFITNPTMTQIVQKYFQTLNAGLTSYTLNQLEVAYYYPVLKETLLDPLFENDVNLTIITSRGLLLPEETVRSRCIYTFQGIDDPVVHEVIKINVVLLNAYRLKHTFRNTLINKYVVTVANNNNRITITSPSLNTSLVTLLNSKYNQYLLEQLNKYNLTTSNYNALSTSNAAILAILTDEYYYIERMFAIYFGINFNSYSLPYYTNMLNQLPLQNALQNLGISSNYDVSVIEKNISPQTLNELSTFRTAAPAYWPRLINLPHSTAAFSTFVNLNSNSAPSTIAEYSHPYTLLTQSEDYLRPFIDASGVIYQNPLYKSGNIITDVNPTEYTVFKFRSNSRQTLRVTALPRPTQYRYPAYNAITYDASQVRIFDNSYAFIQNAQNFNMDVSPSFATSNLITIPGFGKNSSNFGIQYASARSLWNTSNVSLDIQNSRQFFTFYTPQVSNITSTLTYPMKINVSHLPNTSNFYSPINVYLYQDRAAFMADISDVRNEKPIHYKELVSFDIPTANVTLDFTAYARQQYYLMVRTKLSTFNTMQFIVVPSFPGMSTFTELSTTLSNFNPLADPFANLTNYNYAAVADPNFIKLPTSSNLWSQNEGLDSNFATFTNKYVPMGYDRNGVSTDLTDYIGYTPNTLSNTVLNSPTRIDPITGYIFQVGNGYNSSNSNYFPGNGNTLLTSNGLTIYNPTVPKNREFVISHYYSDVFIPNSLNQPFVFYERDVSVVFDTDSNGNTTNAYSIPYVRSLPTDTPYQLVTGNPLQGYNFDNDGVLLSLGDGMTGISIIPDDGVWDIQRLMLRSAYITANSNIDTNRQIQYIGIYNASYVNSIEARRLHLSNALTVLELSTVRTYTSTNTNFGFDRVGGTYYEWVKSSNFIPTSNSYLYGFAQTPDTMIVDSNAFYTAIPFTANSTLTSFSLISGSLVPYPFYSDASASAVYLDGTSTPTGQYVVVPKKKATPGLGPPPGFDQSQSKYEQSIPIGTSVLQYLQSPNLSGDLSGVLPFGPDIFKDISGAPLFNNACFRVSKYVLFEIGGTYSFYSYEFNTEDRTFTPVFNFTPDELFVNLSNSHVVGISGNSSEFAFLGLSATEDPPGNFTYVFQIETFNMDTQTGTTRDTITSSNGLYAIPAGYEIFDIASFNYNDFGGWTFTFRFGQWDTFTNSYINVGQVGMTKGSPIDDPSTPIYYVDSNTFVGGLTPSFEIYQTPNEPFGNFYVAAKTGFAPLSGSNTYSTPCNFTYTEREFVGTWDVTQITSDYAKNGLFYVNTLSNYSNVVELQTSLATNGSPFVYNSSNSNIAPYVYRFAIQPNAGAPGAAFGNITLVQSPIQNKIFLSYNQYDMSNNLTVTYCEVRNIIPSDYFYRSNAVYSASIQVVPSKNGTPIAPYQMLGGGNESFWLLFNENNRIDSNNPSSNLGLRFDSIWGNRGDSFDFPKRIKNAYQIFYPTQRIVLNKVAPSYDPITDLSGLTYPEFPHTCLFAYETLSNFLLDISGNKWGMESSNNFMVADTSFSGNYFNAATLNIPLMSNHEYYLAIRGYTPTEKSQVMLRFSLPNRYDAGYARIIDISNEIILAQQSPTLFNSNFANTLQQFNSNFIFDSNGRVFGSNLLGGFAGVILSNVVGFGDFMNRFINLYNVYTSNAQLLSTINTTVASNLSNFIKTDLATIIPPSAINRQRYTDPLTYSILFRSALEPLYLKSEDNWGLGWNLGFAKQDTPYDTTQVADSFFKILDDYINLRLSPEYDLNRMDTGAKENLQLSQETTGSIKAFHAKLLLANFGSYAQTLISNPLTFQIPVPKMDKLLFEWQDINSQTINNNDCEWNMVLQIVEEYETVKAEKIKSNVVN